MAIARRRGVPGGATLTVLALSLVAAAEPDGGRPPVPFHSACPPRPGAPSECAALASASNRDRSVRAESVRDGERMDLQAMHLIVRRDEAAWIVRELGHDGVGCGTFGLFGARFDVHDVRVRDVLAGPAPEVILRYDTGFSAGGEQLLLCTTDVEPPRCLSRTVGPGRLRFRRPDVVVSSALRFQVDLRRDPAPRGTLGPIMPRAGLVAAGEVTTGLTAPGTA